MSNIHGFSSFRKDDDKKKGEEFSGGGKSSHTAVVRDPSRGKRPVVTITLYKNGFILTGDERGFQDGKDPVNQKIMAELKEGKSVPRELEQPIAKIVGQNHRGEVGIDLKNRSGEMYGPPKPTFKAFQGQGYSMKSESSSSAPTGVSSLGPRQVKVDGSKPKTRILLVLHPRKRAPQEFNLTHTTGDIYSHVLSLTPPDFGPFDLVSGFPPKSIMSDPSKTIEELKLKGASITQRKS
ncbi:hypothetical protein AAMO2058_000670900 [Amorphochlora amoebiformis]